MIWMLFVIRVTNSSLSSPAMRDWTNSCPSLIPKPRQAVRHLQYALSWCRLCLECLERRLLLSVCLYGCVYKIGNIDCACCLNILPIIRVSILQFVVLAQSRVQTTYAGHTKESLARDSVYSRPAYIGCKFGVRARIYMASHQSNTGTIGEIGCC